VEIECSFNEVFSDNPKAYNWEVYINSSTVVSPESVDEITSSAAVLSFSYSSPLVAYKFDSSPNASLTPSINESIRDCETSSFNSFFLLLRLCSLSLP